MKTVGTLILVLFLSCQFALAQDTLYIYKAGVVVVKQPVAGIDSITFNRNYSTVVQATVTDVDGNIYHTVKIGTQTWMVENLKTTKYNDGTPITLITDGYQWSNTTVPSYCWYSNDAITYKNTYGALYNWYAVNTGKLAPTGWHVPTESELDILASYLDGSQVAGSKIKESGNTHWDSDNSDATNSSGFTALPGGYRSCETGNYRNLGMWGVFWSSSEILRNGGRYMFSKTSPVFDILSDCETSGFSVRCIKDSLLIDSVKLPTLVSVQASAITNVSAISGGNISSDGGAAITSRGVCWSTLPNPTVANSKTNDGTGTGSFTSTITGLKVDSTYYVRSYATNSLGTAYGNQVSFTTSQTITDVDGNVYHTVKIGTQTWMIENLKTTKYNDGTPITLITDGSQWWNTTVPGYCWYSNDAITYKNTYGALYNWYAVNTGKLAPVGWHVPTMSEINNLASYLDGSQVAGSKIKESGNTHWDSDNSDATNSSGFTALPGGYRSCETGNYRNLGMWGVFWSSSEILRNGGRYMFSKTSPVFDILSDCETSGFSVRCIKDSLLIDSVKLPTLVSVQASAITDVSAISGGNISSDGGAAITARGVCWSTLPNPTVVNSKTTDGTGIGSFTSTITGLKVDSIYYVRAYATNSAGTTYGNQVSFTTSRTVTDIDGNVYNTVKIGTQTWMAGDLKTTKFNDGTTIPLVTDKAAWANLSTPGYCWYNNDSTTYNTTYGALYNWYAVNTGKLAPVGWHVASDAEWTTITTFLGEDVAGGKLKETGTLHWTSPNTGATNETGFTALPGGDRGNNDGTFDAIGIGCFWWTSTPQNDVSSYFRSVGCNGSGVGRSGSPLLNGLYVRCVKD